MISSYNSAQQTVEIGGLISFDTNRIKTSCATEHVAGSPTFILRKPGYYYVSFDTIATSTDTGNITVQLRNGTELVPGAVAMTDIAATSDVETLTFSTIIQVRPSCCAVDNTATISIINSGIAASFTAPNITITKLC